MNKNVKIITLLFVATAFAATAMHFLRPFIHSSNHYFGYADIAYGLHDEVKITDCSGDTDKLRSVSYTVRPANRNERGNSSGTRAIFEATFIAPKGMIAITANSYTEGHMINGRPLPVGCIERMVGDRWEPQDDIWTEYVVMSYGGGIEYPVVRQAEETVRFSFEWRDSGVYRVTYRFREHLKGGNTGEKLYEISHTVILPKIEDTPFEVQRVDITERALLNTYEVKPVVMINEGSLYIDRMYAKLEKRSGNQWEEEKGAVSVYDGDEKWRYRGGERKYLTVSDRFSVNVDDPSADYRLTLHFTENEDGSGEQYAITLNLRFDE